MMSEFWESNFKEKQAMWGYEPTDIAKSTAAFFKEKRLQEILIPGIGYGRNAKPFIENGMQVTGIEISKTAVELAEVIYGNLILVYLGSVLDKPIEQKKYDGIFCYALIHLLEYNERLKLIKTCYEQLKSKGIMIFVSISSNDAKYGKGELISKNRFETPHGVNLFFYDEELIIEEFKDFGIIKVEEINEPKNISEDKPNQKFWVITCKKGDR